MKNQDNKERICCFFNYSPHYRKGIYEQLNKVGDYNFFFAKNCVGQMKSIDFKESTIVPSFFRNIIVANKIVWQTCLLGLLFSSYKKFILTADTACLTHWIFMFCAKKMKKEVYFWTHGIRGNENKFHLKKNICYFKLATGLLLYSKHSMNLMTDLGFNEAKMRVIANSLDYDSHLKLRDGLVKTDRYKQLFSNNNPVLIFVGRLTRVKKLDMIVRACAKLSCLNNNVNVYFIGEGGEKSYLQELASELGVSELCKFHGGCYDESELGELIYNADICVSPGNVGLTAIHSLSFGTPVITHNNFSDQMPEFEAIVESGAGSFFRQGDQSSLVETISKWLANNPEKNTDLIKRCYEIIDAKYNPYSQFNVIQEFVNNN